MQKPNIIMILVDDMGWKDLACFGSMFHETPNIDKLALESTNFSSAYSTCPVCSPSRASIMSGKYPARIGVTDWIGAHTYGKLIDAPYIKQLPLNEKSIASVLKDNGYNTWHIGKWHLGKREYYPDKHGFEVNIGGNHHGHPYNGYYSPWNLENLDNGTEGEYLTDRLTNEAVNLIKNNEEKPFFLNLWHYTVHTPIQAKPEHIERFEKKVKERGLDKLSEFEEGGYFPCHHKSHMRIQRRLIQSNPTYAAMIYNLDESVGKIVETLKETGKYDNTIIVFTSDNGGLTTEEGSPTTNKPLIEGKGWMYEGGVRVPLFIKWVNGERRTDCCEVPVTGCDFYPTFLEAAELPFLPEQHVDGVSLLPLLTGNGKIEREAIYWHYPHYGNQGGTPAAAIRMGDYKLIKFYEDESLELYNLREDISESKNLIKKQADIANKMEKRLIDWQMDIEAKFPKKNPDWIQPQ